ncbi:MAG: hypothetical protein IT245_05170 [Bacteroidia bacterium]|nr:hypothetical protein [Bacteroidia bacterium]
MNVQIIKKIVEAYSVEQLKQAESDLLNEIPLQIEVEGVDEGEQLTHILAAIFCKEEMASTGVNINLAIRAYSQRVRNSIN